MRPKLTYSPKGCRELATDLQAEPRATDARPTISSTITTLTAGANQEGEEKHARKDDDSSIGKMRGSPREQNSFTLIIQKGPAGICVNTPQTYSDEDASILPAPDTTYKPQNDGHRRFPIRVLQVRSCSQTAQLGGPVTPPRSEGPWTQSPPLSGLQLTYLQRSPLYRVTVTTRHRFCGPNSLPFALSPRRSAPRARHCPWC